MDKYFVYILFSEKANRYYIGYTSNIQQRLEEHNDSNADSSKYAIKNGPWKLVYHEAGFKSRTEAIKREKEIKGWKSRKMIEMLIAAEKLA